MIYIYICIYIHTCIFYLPFPNVIFFLFAYQINYFFGLSIYLDAYHVSQCVKNLPTDARLYLLLYLGTVLHNCTFMSYNIFNTQCPYCAYIYIVWVRMNILLMQRRYSFVAVSNNKYKDKLGSFLSKHARDGVWY